MTFTKCFNFYSKAEEIAQSPDYEKSLNFVFANTQEEESIYPLTISEIAEAQLMMLISKKQSKKTNM